MRQTLHATFLFSFLIPLLFVHKANAQIRWVGEGAGGRGTSFNQPANWDANRVPTASDDVEIIITTNSAVIELSNDIEVRNFTFKVQKDIAVVSLNTRQSKLTINGVSIFEVAQGADGSLISFGAGNNTSASIVDFKDNVYLNTIDANGVGIYLEGNIFSKMIFGGDLTLGNKVRVSAARPVNAVFDGAGTQLLSFNNKGYTAKFNNVTIGDKNSPILQLTGNRSEEILGNLIINKSAWLYMDTVLWDRNSYGGSLLVNGNGGIKLATERFLSNFATIMLAPVSTVEYNGAADRVQTIYPITYGNLILSGPAGGANALKNSGGDFTVAGNFETGAQTDFQAFHFRYGIGGSFVSNGVFQAGLSTVALNGSGDQNIRGNDMQLNHLEVDKPSGKAVVDGNSIININGQLILTNGIVGTDSANLIHLTAGAAVAGSSDTSFISGPMRKTGNTAFIFPVGKGAKKVSIAISAPANITDAFTAEYFPANPFAGDPRVTGLQSISTCEYWNLERTAGTSAIDVTLYWSASNACTGAGYISDPATTVAAHYNGSSWNVYGGIGAGTADSGSVTWSGVTQFSPFTLGSISGGTANPLPVVFIDLKAVEETDGVHVSFANLTEENVATYEVERSADGITFTSIATITPTANNGSRADYLNIDKTPLDGDNYYRIKAVDNSGTIFYSDTVQLTVTASPSAMLLFPNPVRRNETLTAQLKSLPAGAYTIQVYNVAGQLFSNKQFAHAGGSLNETVPVKNKAAGRYIMVVNGPVRLVQSFLVQ